MSDQLLKFAASRLASIVTVQSSHMGRSAGPRDRHTKQKVFIDDLISEAIQILLTF